MVMAQLGRVPLLWLRALPAPACPTAAASEFFSGAFIGCDQLHAPCGHRRQEGEQRGGERGGSRRSATGRGRRERDGLPGAGARGCFLRFPEPLPLLLLGSGSVTVEASAASSQVGAWQSQARVATAAAAQRRLLAQARGEDGTGGRASSSSSSSSSMFCGREGRAGGKVKLLLLLSPDLLRGLMPGLGAESARAILRSTRGSLVPLGDGKIPPGSDLGTCLRAGEEGRPCGFAGRVGAARRRLRFVLGRDRKCGELEGSRRCRRLPRNHDSGRGARGQELVASSCWEVAGEQRAK